MVNKDLQEFAKALFIDDNDGRMHTEILLFSVLALAVGIANMWCNTLRAMIGRKKQ